MSRPQPFGAYDLLARINVGGMAEVFKAVHRDTKRTVAIKRILPSIAEDEEFISMFRDEATIASRLDHPNIAKIFDLGRVDASYFIAMEYIDGRDLRTITDNATRRRTPLPKEFVVYVMSSLCAGLDYAHRRPDARGRPMGLVHRDVSPQNVLVSQAGDVKLIDFGIAKAAGKLARTQVGSIKGKFGYMSPEQVRGLPVDHRSDIFSAGICLWEFLTLQRLFQGDNEIVVMDRIRNADIPSPAKVAPGIDVELERITLRALARDAEQRYSSASEFQADLNAYASKVGWVAHRDRAADYIQKAFLSSAAIAPAPPSEETHVMAENKGGSDLDVFEGLARKPQSIHPGAASAPSLPAPPVPGSRPGVPAPPPPRARTLLGMASLLPSTPPTAPPAPPASKLPPPSVPGLPPPARHSGAPVPPPPPKSVPPPPRGPQASSPNAALPPAAPPPMSAAAAAAQPATVEMDWDDEDEKTNVYDKQTEQEMAQNILRPLPAAGTPAPPPASAAASLLSRSGNVAAPMPRQASLPAAVPFGPGETQIPSSPPQPLPFAQAQPTVAAREPKSGSSIGLLLAAVFGVLLLGTVAVGGFFLFSSPPTGTVKIYVAGPGNTDVKAVKIFVDNKQVCESSPCKVENLSAGIHDVKAIAEGYQPAAPKGVQVVKGEQKVELELRIASAGTGFKATSAVQGVKLFVDGTEIGPLPQTLTTLSPGDHKLRFDAGDRYKPEEKTVTVTPDKIEDLGDIKLIVAKGKATLELVTRGARILLVPSSGEKRLIDERMFANNQLSVEIDTSKEWRIEASKASFDDLNLPISFTDGQAEKTFRIELHETGKATAAADTAKATTGAPTTTAAPSDTGKPATTAPAAAGGQAKLNINSMPPSAVLVDGRPVGRTPRSGLVVTPGTHNVTFIHPEKGRKSASVTVGPGETKGVGVRF